MSDFCQTAGILVWSEAGIRLPIRGRTKQCVYVLYVYATGCNLCCTRFECIEMFRGGRCSALCAKGPLSRTAKAKMSHRTQGEELTIFQWNRTNTEHFEVHLVAPRHDGCWMQMLDIYATVRCMFPSSGVWPQQTNAVAMTAMINHSQCGAHDQWNFNGYKNIVLLLCFLLMVCNTTVV